jgi:hypothetical protein
LTLKNKGVSFKEDKVVYERGSTQMLKPEPVKIDDKKLSFTGVGLDSPGPLSAPMKLMLQMM